MERNSVLTGIVAGCILPVLGFWVVELIFNTMTDLGVMEEVSLSTSGKRFRTLVLLAICFNLLPLHFFKSRRWENSMRGVIFPTLIYAAAWVWKFGGELFGY